MFPLPTINTILHKRQAFTLIELIIYIGLTAIIVVAMTRTLVTVTSSRAKTDVQSSLQQEMRFALQRMETTVRSARGINTGSSTFVADNGVLSLVMSGALNPTVFRLSSNAITIQEGAGAEHSLTSSGVHITALHFTNLSAPDIAPTVRIAISGTDARSNDEDRTYVDSLSLQTSITLRSYE